MKRVGRMLLALLLVTAPALSRASAAGKLHEVKPGETLALIASRTLGDPQLWPAIYAANRDRIKDPARVYPGQQLAIPALDDGAKEAARREAEEHPLRTPDVSASGE